MTTNPWFWFSILVTRPVDSSEPEFFWTSLRLFVKKKCFGSRRAPLDLWNNIKVQNQRNCMKSDTRTTIIWLECAIFRILSFCRVSFGFLGARIFLTSLGLFVKKKCVGSRRAPLDLANNIKVENQINCMKNDTNRLECGIYACFVDLSVF